MAISAQQVKQLRDKTGAGMMDCKKALADTGGDEEKAIAWLREKGLSKAAKKAGRATTEGMIGSYIHTTGKIGVMVELLCESDFVARNEKFQELAKDIAMQIAAINPVCVSSEDLPQEDLERERALYRKQALDEGKPENIVDKIVDGRLQKYYKEVCLLDQTFIKDDKKTIQDIINETIAVLGENIQVGRFVRMQLGEEG
jgi:elongation factor Ts